MRIISGRLKGRRLKNFKASHIRPTTDRAKESIFNKLATYLEGASVLDLYAGTGNLSIESYSRGASSIVAVELSRKSAQIIRDNLKLFGISEAILLVIKDVFSYLTSYTGDGFDLIFVDPPFTQKLADKTMQALVRSKVLNDDSIIIIEATKHETINDNYDNWVLWDRKDLGDKSISFYIMEEK